MIKRFHWMLAGAFCLVLLGVYDQSARGSATAPAIGMPTPMPSFAPSLTKRDPFAAPNDNARKKQDSNAIVLSGLVPSDGSVPPLAAFSIGGNDVLASPGDRIAPGVRLVRIDGNTVHLSNGTTLTWTPELTQPIVQTITPTQTIPSTTSTVPIVHGIPQQTPMVTPTPLDTSTGAQL
jgi:hypothetical protein